RCPALDDQYATVVTEPVFRGALRMQFIRQCRLGDFARAEPEGRPQSGTSEAPRSDRKGVSDCGDDRARRLSGDFPKGGEAVGARTARAVVLDVGRRRGVALAGSRQVEDFSAAAAWSQINHSALDDLSGRPGGRIGLEVGHYPGWKRLGRRCGY